MFQHDPGVAGLTDEAAAHLRAGQFAAAERLLRQALLSQASNPDILYALGTALAGQGRLAEALPHLETAVLAAPGNSGHWKIALDVAQALGDRKAQARLYRALAGLQPGNAIAHHKLGNVLRELDCLAEAEEAWRAAVAANPGFAPAHTNLGVAAKLRGDFRAAEQSFRAALKIAPGSAAVRRNLGSVLEQAGDLAGAEQQYRHALANAPDDPHTRKYLGGVLLEQGRLDDAFAVFMEHAQRHHGAGASPAGPVAEHKRMHDREQQAWLGDPGRDPGRLFIMGGERLAGAAINRQPDAADRWNRARPPVVVIDDFLTTAALDALRRFCLGSTIWRATFPGGYLGALPEHGFAVPLLAQLGEELAAGYPEIFAGHPLLQLWAFKYGRTPTGIRMHADFAAVNVNFWITPDAANRDPDRGGLVIWDKPAPPDWDFETYNNDRQAMLSFLAQSGAKATTVPYRANRAVIFDSDLFHETDRIDFAEGYENRRINITFLYGWRGGMKRTD
ncbi:MAG TPA: tetratricopeptide repeat protein [Rhizomicrobium sp.]|nr:tetratricopeptide repeat protein [Rhizomicrobium sp.]